jgi:hypothetical protein
MRSCVLGVLVALLTGPGLAGQPASTQTALAEALTAAIQPALPFPAAQDDGTPADGSSAPVWTVRWPAAGQTRLEVLANPLNPKNHERALKVEEEIQEAAMRSQRQSQADYEQALKDFQRTGRVGEIREISLGDDGVAGERYDAESQLVVIATMSDSDHEFGVDTSRLPQPVPGIDGAPAVVRMAANASETHFYAEQAWVFFGAIEPPKVTQLSATRARVAVARRTDAGGAPIVIVSLRGNAELVERVLRQADWHVLRARFGG